MIKKALQSLFNFFGVSITRLPRKKIPDLYYRNPEMIGGFSRFINLGLPIKTIIDVGAADGSWSRTAREFWPSASILMVEPLEERQSILQAIIEQNSGFDYLCAAAGNQQSSVNYLVSDDLDGSLVAESLHQNEPTRMVQQVKLDDVVQEKKLAGPYLLKLDTHGYELPILEGAADLLKNANLVIIECYGFHITKTSPLFWELCAVMNRYGFRVFDVIEIVRRPGDDAFWQCDIFFIPGSSNIYLNNQYC